MADVTWFSRGILSASQACRSTQRTAHALAPTVESARGTVPLAISPRARHVVGTLPVAAHGDMPDHQEPHEARLHARRGAPRADRGRAQGADRVGVRGKPAAQHAAHSVRRRAAQGRKRGAGGRGQGFGSGGWRGGVSSGAPRGSLVHGEHAREHAGCDAGERARTRCRNIHALERAIARGRAPPRAAGDPTARASSGSAVRVPATARGDARVWV